jgi:hypothetical protein
VEVKIGVLHSPRELVVESAHSQDEIQQIVTDALASDDGLLTLTDEKGRRVVVPTKLVAYVEIAQPDVRKVGFAT